MKRIPDTFPDKDAIRDVYEHICYYYQMAMGDGYNVTREFDLDEFCRTSNTFRSRPTVRYIYWNGQAISNIRKNKTTPPAYTFCSAATSYTAFMNSRQNRNNSSNGFYAAMEACSAIMSLWTNGVLRLYPG